MSEELPPEPGEEQTKAPVRDSTVRNMVLKLIDGANMTPQDISEAMDKRVSARTIYRWAKGESEPQNEADLRCLEDLVGVRTK